MGAEVSNQTLKPQGSQGLEVLFTRWQLASHHHLMALQHKTDREGQMGKGKEDKSKEGTVC